MIEYSLIKWYPSLPENWKINHKYRYFTKSFLMDNTTTNETHKISKLELHPDFWRKKEVNTIESKSLIQTFANELGIHVDILKSKNRDQNIVLARNMYWLLERAKNNRIYREIGFITGHHHSSVIVGIKKIEWLLAKKDPEVIEIYHKIKHLFPAGYNIYIKQ